MWWRLFVVQVERGDWLQEVDKKNKRWAVSLARSSGVDVDWGICCGSSKIDLLSVGRTEDNYFPGCSDGGDGIGACAAFLSCASSHLCSDFCVDDK